MSGTLNPLQIADPRGDPNNPLAQSPSWPGAYPTDALGAWLAARRARHAQMQPAQWGWQPMNQGQPMGGMSLADMMANLRGPTPMAPINYGMTDTNLQAMITGTPQLAARLRPAEGGPQYPGAPIPGWQGFNGTG